MKDHAVTEEPGLDRAEKEIVEILVRIWREVLGTEDVGPQSDFFQLGGDSLQMMTLLFRISQDIGMELDPGTVFDNPTVAQLAAALANQKRAQSCETILQEGTI